MHLDGVIQAVRTMESHYVTGRESYVANCIDIKLLDQSTEPLEDDEKTGWGEWVPDVKHRNFINCEVLSRISCIQVAFIAIDMAVTETLRGSIRIIGGVFTLNLTAISNGLTDWISVVMQAIALPLMALVSIFSPLKAIALGQTAIHYFQSSDDNCEFSNYRRLSTYGEVVFGALYGVVLIPLSLVRSALRVPIHIIDADPINTICAVICIIKEPLANLGTLFSPPCMTKFHEYDARGFSLISNKALWFMLPNAHVHRKKETASQESATVDL